MFLLRPISRTQIPRLFPIVMIGYTGNVILPMRLGEAIRIYLATGTARIPASAVFSSVIPEYAFDLSVIASILAITAAITTATSVSLLTAIYTMTTVGLGIFTAAVIVSLWTDWFMSTVRKLTGFLSPGI